MPVIVNATEKNPTHHVSFTTRDGTTIGLLTYIGGSPSPLASGRAPVDRTAMKTTSGNPKYSDFEPPYSPIVQDDFSGGRGSAEFERDVTKYADANRVNTRRVNRAFLGGRESYTTGVQAGDHSMPGSVRWIGLVGGARFVTKPFQASTSYTAARLWVLIRKVGKPTGDLSVRIRSDSANTPGAVLQTAVLAVASVTDVISEWHIFDITPTNLTATTQYWIEIFGASGDTSKDHWQVATSAVTVTSQKSVDGTTYSLADYDLYFRVNPVLSTTNGFFFEYRGVMYFVTKPATGAPGLYINGDRGAADSNSADLTLLNDATKSWVVNVWTGCIVVIIGGLGKSEPQPWRTITSNSATVLVCDTDWTITHDTTTEYAIIGSNAWTEVSGHGLTVPVSEPPLVSGKGIVYFPQGDTVAMRRMRDYNNAGTWVREFAADGTNKAKLLLDMGLKIWKANDDDSGTGVGDASVDSANPEPWGTNLTFSGNLRKVATISINAPGTGYAVNDVLTLAAPAGGTSATATVTYVATGGIVTGVALTTKGTLYSKGTKTATVAPAGGSGCTINVLTLEAPIVCGSNLYRITNLVAYPDDADQMAPWVLKEEIIGFVKVGIFYPLLLSEMGTVRSPKNGIAAVTLNSYLYFSLMNGLERYYRPTLDDIGPNLGEGLPASRQGAVLNLLGYPGRTFGVINAGSGYSSILAYDNNGWHEEYRAPIAQQIQTLGFQVIPGTTSDRLYLLVGSDIAYLPFPSETTNPLSDPVYSYTHEGSLELSKMYAGMQDAQKFVKAIRIVTDNLLSGHQEIYLDYKVDGATTWTELGVYDTSPVMELDFSDEFGLAGKELTFRLRFYTDSSLITPILKTIIIDTITRVPNKFAYSLPFMIQDGGMNLRNEPEELSAAQRIAMLDAWASETMLLMRSVNPLLDNRLVFLLPIDSRPLDASIIDSEWRYQGVLVAQDA